jgi:hypothetical protein
MTVPDELRRSAPRSVSLTIAGKALTGLALLFVLTALIGGAWLYARASNDAARRVLRAAKAVTTPGQIVKAAHRSGKESRWLMTYTFEVDGVLRTGSFTARAEIAAGTPVEIGYLPSEPDDNWMIGHEPRGVPLLLAPVFGVCFIALAALICVVVERQKQLLANGRGAIARVTGSRRIPQPEGGSVRRVRYEFTLLSGSVCQGKFDTHGKAPAVNSEIVVIYDPDHPKKSARYPLRLLRLGRE